MSQGDLLQPLVGAIEKAKQRIEAHGALLRENEIRTRNVLIDPILFALGWDTSDLALVTSEYDVQGLRADYALLKEDGRPAVVLEAKHLGEGLEQHLMQMLNYANASGVDYAGLTDGDKWELYKVFTPGALSDRRVLHVSIMNESAPAAALQLLRLWRPNLRSGAAVDALCPVVGVPGANGRNGRPDPTVGWTPLPRLQQRASGENQPQKIRFAGESEKVISSYKGVLVETTRWLAREGLLNASALPLVTEKRATLVNSSPQRANGNTMLSPREVAQNVFVETHWSAKDAVRAARRIVEAVGRDPSSVEVLLPR